jgi:hypothetical protein
MMGRLGIWRPVDRYQHGPLHIPIVPRRLVFHTAVSSASSLHDFFNVPGRPTPHFYVNKIGVIEQYIDTSYRATACLDGNHDCIAVESWDGTEIVPWTNAQVEACAWISAYCMTEHHIPVERLRSSKPGTTGVGWHRLGIDGNFADPPGTLLGGRVKGGEHWSESFGKLCPGDPKILGVVNRIIPRAKELLMNGDDMQLSDRLYPAQHGNHTTVGDALRRADHLDERFAAVNDRFAHVNDRFSVVNDRLAEISRQIADLAALVRKQT